MTNRARCREVAAPRDGAILWRVLPLLLFTLAAASFASSLGFGFIMDDWPQIADNPRLAGLSLLEMLTGGVWENSALPQPGDVYRPLFMLWLAAFARAAGPDALWFHAGNIALHGLVTLLVWRLGHRLIGRTAAAAAAALFATHPVHVASVAWISGATDLLAAVFCLLAALLYLRWLDLPRPALLVAVALAYVGALAAKESAIVLPAALVLLGGGQAWRQRRAHAPLLATLVGLAAVWLWARAMALDGIAAEGGLTLSATALPRLGDALALAVEALVFGARGFYFRPPADVMASWLALPALALLAGAVRATPRPLVLAALAWTTVFLVPGLAVAFHEHGAFGTRFLYLPSVGVCLLAGAALTRLPARRTAVATGALALGGLAFSHILAAEWRDDGSFYAMVVDLSPEQGGGYIGLARHHLRQGDSAAAEATYAQAASRVSNDSDRFSLIEDHALLLARAGRFSEAAEQFRRLAEHPRFRAVGLNGLLNVALATGDDATARRLANELKALRSQRRGGHASPP